MWKNNQKLVTERWININIALERWRTMRLPFDKSGNWNTYNNYLCELSLFLQPFYIKWDLGLAGVINTGTNYMWLRSKSFSHDDGRFFPVLLPFLFTLEGVIPKLTVELEEIVFVCKLTLWAFSSPNYEDSIIHYFATLDEKLHAMLIQQKLCMCQDLGITNPGIH